MLTPSGAYAGLFGREKPILARFDAISLLQRATGAERRENGPVPKREAGKTKSLTAETAVSYIYIEAGRRFSSLTIFKRGFPMCRNIKTLFNFDPPVTSDEVRAASLQFVRKITGFNKPSQANELAFTRAVDEIANVSLNLLQSLETTAHPKNREEEAAKAKARAAERFGD